MRVLENSEQIASEELSIVIKKWQEIITDLSQNKDRQISSKKAQRIRNNFFQDERRFHLFFTDADKFTRKVDSFVNEYGTKLDIALIDGQQRYEKAMYEQNLATITAYGVLAKNLGINIAVLVVGVVGTLFGTKVL